MARYAQKTSVDPGRSRDEVERTLRRYGASQFATGWTERHMVVSFVVNERHIRFVIDVPDPTSSEFTRTETGRLVVSGATATSPVLRAVPR